jgi:hypothetical protein
MMSISGSYAPCSSVRRFSERKPTTFFVAYRIEILIHEMELRTAVMNQIGIVEVMMMTTL